MYNLDGCNFTDTTIQATTVIYFFTYYIVLPYFITAGLVCDILLIVALVRQTRLKRTYGYQVQLACSRTLHCLAFGAYSCGAYWWAGLGGTTSDWFVRSYALMVFTMKVLLAVMNMAYFLSLFLSVAITCDRVYSLARPLWYKAMNHRVHQSVVGAVLTAIACPLAADKYFGFNIVEKSAKNGSSEIYYQYEINPEFVGSEWGRASESVRVYVRAVCLIALMVFNVAMIAMHRRRIKRLETMTVSNEERVRARRETNKDLTILAACQSILSYLDHVVNMFGQLLRQVSPYWIKCSYVATAEVNCTVMLVGIAEFFLFLAVNRRLRMSVPGYKWLSVICMKKAGGGGAGGNRVGTVATHKSG